MGSFVNYFHSRYYMTIYSLTDFNFTKFYRLKTQIYDNIGNGSEVDKTTMITKVLQVV
jgi:hypothetical protein